MSNEDADRTKVCQITVRDNCLFFFFLSLIKPPPVKLGRRQFKRFVVSLLLVLICFLKFCVVSVVDILLCLMTCIIVIICLFSNAQIYFTVTSQRYNLAGFSIAHVPMLCVHKQAAAPFQFPLEYWASLIFKSMLWADVFWCYSRMHELTAYLKSKCSSVDIEGYTVAWSIKYNCGKKTAEYDTDLWKSSVSQFILHRDPILYTSANAAQKRNSCHRHICKEIWETFQ